nr:PREDICTED: uncharacterized protein LOC109454178 [Rhinolophus sinicus]
MTFNKKSTNHHLETFSTCVSRVEHRGKARAWAWEPAEELDPLWLLRAVRLGFPRASNPDANVQTGMWAVQNKAHKTTVQRTGWGQAKEATKECEPTGLPRAVAGWNPATRSARRRSQRGRGLCCRHIGSDTTSSQPSSPFFKRIAGEKAGGWALRGRAELPRRPGRASISQTRIGRAFGSLPRLRRHPRRTAAARRRAGSPASAGEVQSPPPRACPGGARRQAGEKRRLAERRPPEWAGEGDTEWSLPGARTWGPRCEQHSAHVAALRWRTRDRNGSGGIRWRVPLAPPAQGTGEGGKTVPCCARAKHACSEPTLVGLSVPHGLRAPGSRGQRGPEQAHWGRPAPPARVPSPRAAGVQQAQGDRGDNHGLPSAA